jgi:hypothetical protein
MMAGAAWAAFLTLCAAMAFMTGIIWGGPWPPRATTADGRADRLKLAGLRPASLGWAVAVLAIMWKVPLLDNVAVQYALFAVLPLALGAGARRILLLREPRP